MVKHNYNKRKEELKVLIKNAKSMNKKFYFWELELKKIEKRERRGNKNLFSFKF